MEDNNSFQVTAPIKKVYLYGTWVADGDVSLVVSELSKGVFEYEVMHVH
ncbi:MULTISPECIES: hypothetical protein [unclassified Exiguobacterium]|nr:MULTISPECIES: hypothetical protein [unclassified Exiguobacterium]